MAEHKDSESIKKGFAPELFDTTGLILDYLAHWKWFVLSVVVLLIGAYFYGASIVPMYQVNASVYLNNENKRANEAIAMSPQMNMVTKDYIDQTEIEILKSRNSVVGIVDSLKLSYSYWRKGNLRDIPLYDNNAFVARIDSVDLVHLRSNITITVDKKDDNKYDVKALTYYNGLEEKKDFSDVELPMDVQLSTGTVTVDKSPNISNFDGTQYCVITNPRWAAARISGGLNISYAANAPTIIRISFSTPEPQEGIDVINTLVDLYNKQIIREENRAAIQTEAFILDRLVNINDELHDVEQRLLDYRQSHGISDLDAQLSANLTTKMNTETQLTEVDAELRNIGSLEEVISKADEYATLPSVTTDGTLNGAIEAYNRKVSQLNRMRENSTDDNPLVRSMQEDLQREKGRIMQTISSVRSSVQSRRGTIAALGGRSQGALSSLPPIDKGLQEIFREQQVKVNIYTFLLQKREEIALQKTLATPTARLIDDPTATGPVSPNRSQIYMMAFIIGLLIPAVIILVKRLLFPVFKDQEELQRLTQIPILGEIASNTDKDLNPIVVGHNVSTPIAELFRLLRNNIGFTRNGADKRVILVTSSISGEGKTFISTNLAMTYALTGKKVVVVGMDIRRPALAHRFGLSNQQGVTTFLSGQVSDIKPLIHQSKENPNLYVMPAGPIPPNPNELLLSDNMNRLIGQLRHDFDYIIIDTAPIGVISDSFLVVPHSDIQLLVARAGYSTSNCLKVLHKAIQEDRLPDPYIVLNDVDITANSYSYRKYGHYYHNGAHVYGYGYTHEDKGDK